MWNTPSMGTDKQIDVLFVSSGQYAETYFKALHCKLAPLYRLKHIKADERTDPEVVQRSAVEAHVVVVGTCKRVSLTKDSPIQKIEVAACAAATSIKRVHFADRTTPPRLVLVAEEAYELAMPHLEEARRHCAYAMIAEEPSGLGGLLDLFPVETHVHAAPQTEAGYERARSALTALLQQ